MVSVIIQKPAPKDVVKKIVCRRGCGSTLGYIKKDIKSYHGTDAWGGPDGREWIVCPVCKEELTLNSW